MYILLEILRLSIFFIHQINSISFFVILIWSVCFLILMLAGILRLSLFSEFLELRLELSLSLLFSTQFFGWCTVSSNQIYKVCAKTPNDFIFLFFLSRVDLLRIQSFLFKWVLGINTVQLTYFNQPSLINLSIIVTLVLYWAPSC